MTTVNGIRLPARPMNRLRKILGKMFERDTRIAEGAGAGGPGLPEAATQFGLRHQPTQRFRQRDLVARRDQDGACLRQDFHAPPSPSSPPATGIPPRQRRCRTAPVPCWAGSECLPPPANAAHPGVDRETGRAPRSPPPPPCRPNRSGRRCCSACCGPPAIQHSHASVRPNRRARQAIIHALSTAPTGRPAPSPACRRPFPVPLAAFAAQRGDRTATCRQPDRAGFARGPANIPIHWLVQRRC